MKQYIEVWGPNRCAAPRLTALCLAIFTLAWTASAAVAAPEFGEWSTGATLRIGLYHGSVAGEKERFALAALRQEGRWPGSRTHLIDTLNLGTHLVVISDVETNAPLFSRGFSSPLEAEATWSATTVFVRIPMPRRRVQLVVKSRDVGNIGFVDVWSGVLDPATAAIDRSPLTTRATVLPILDNGDPATKVDVAILGDGYAIADQQKFVADARRASEQLFAAEPFKSRSSAFNVSAVFVPSEDSGISSPLEDRWRRTAFGSSYNSLNIERRIDTVNDTAVHEAAATVPSDFIILLTNSRRYGGSARYQRFSVAAADSGFSPYLVVHEFAHHFAGLEDEYYTLAECNRGPKVEPWAPNVTTTTDREGLKWKSLLQPGVAIPSRWSKAEYEKADEEFASRYFAMRQQGIAEADVERFIVGAVSRNREILAKGATSGVGLFEGAASEACGLFRPEHDCTMFTLVPDRFCSVCRHAIERVIEFFAA